MSRAASMTCAVGREAATWREFVGMLDVRLASGGRFVPPLIVKELSKPGYFDVLMNSLNIMQDHVTRANFLAISEPMKSPAPMMATVAFRFSVLVSSGCLMRGAMDGA